MKNNLMAALKVFGMTVFAALIGFFIYVSIYQIFNIGADATYAVYMVDSNGQFLLDESGNYIVKGIYNEYPTCGEGELPVKVFDYSSATITARGLLQQICMLGTYLVLVLSVIFNIGNQDRNNVDFNGKVYDKFKGLKIGLFAAIPSAVVYLFFVYCKLTGIQFYNMYMWLNIIYKPFMDLITNDATTIYNVSWTCIAIMLLFVLILPLVCFIGYRIAYDQDTWIARILYKSKEKKGKA